MSANVGDIIATTLRNRRKNLADTVINHNALLRKLDEGGSIKEAARGGRTICEPLIYGTNNSVQFYTDRDTFTPGNDDVVDMSEWNWKQLGGFVTISGLEKIKNSGSSQLIDLLEARTKQLQSQLRNTASTSLYSDGTGSSSKEFGGLQLIVADDPTAAGTVGGINQVTNSWWRNYTSTSITLGSTTIYAAMEAAWLALQYGPEHPDLIVADSVMFTYYDTATTNIQRITTQEKAQLGFPTIMFKGQPVVYDSACTAKRMYFLNTDALAFRYAPNRWFEVEDARKVTTADYDVVPVFTAGNLTTSNRKRHGVIIDD